MDKLKIDRSFVAAVARESRSRELVTAIISMARALDLTVTAEGIENQAQATVLRAASCQRGQGYFLARPATADETFALLAGALEPGVAGA
jgi:EAL domain-containing protein (putative c-di-GMP-specific phosphodiesterase class I)